MDKALAFEYLISRYISWYNERSRKSGIPEDFTILKLIKLHFFTVAASSNKDDSGLLAEFNRFFAMPLGPVEGDVYASRTDLSFYRFNDKKLVAKNNLAVFNSALSSDDINRLNLGLTKLQEFNPDIVLYSPSQLVQLSHKWRCWQLCFSLAKKLQNRAYPIDPFLIQNDIKHFL